MGRWALISCLLLTSDTGRTGDSVTPGDLLEPLPLAQRLSVEAPFPSQLSWAVRAPRAAWGQDCTSAVPLGEVWCGPGLWDPCAPKHTAPTATESATLLGGAGVGGLWPQASDGAQGGQGCLP